MMKALAIVERSWSGALTLCLLIGVSTAFCTLRFRPHVSPVDPEIVALIDQLVDVSEEGAGFHSTAWASGFVAVDQEPKFGGGVLGSNRPVVSSPLRELVRRGTAALPDLLNRVTDDRNTKLVVQNFGRDSFGSTWLDTEYDPRHRDAPQRPGVNRRHSFGDIERIKGPYRVKVGDLCFIAVGQIVNRELAVLRYQPTACLVINSPVGSPALAAAVRADWSGLTIEQHASSLREDMLNAPLRENVLFNGWHESAALIRLCFYYPNEGERAAAELLAKRGDVEAHARVIDVLSYVRNQRVDELVRQTALQDVAQPVDEFAHTKLIRALTPFDSDTVDDCIHKMFLAADLEKYQGADRIRTDDFVCACIDRMIGKKLDHEFEAYCTKRLQELNSLDMHPRETRRREYLRGRLEELQRLRVGK